MTYDYVVVLSAEKKNQETGSFEDLHDGKFIGSKLRMEAARLAFLKFKNAQFILVGGLDKGSTDLGLSQKTKEMAEYIGEGEEPERITRLNSLPCTRHNIARLRNFLEQNKIAKVSVGVLTNFFHLPRAFKFIAQEFAEEKQINFFPIAAETFLPTDSVADYFSLYQESYMQTLQKEVLGLRAEARDDYKDKCLLRSSEYDRGVFEHYEEIIKKHGDSLLSREDLLN